MNRYKGLGQRALLFAAFASLLGCRGSTHGPGAPRMVEHTPGRGAAGDEGDRTQTAAADADQLAEALVLSKPNVNPSDTNPAQPPSSPLDPPTRAAAKVRPSTQVVVLVHGMGRTTASMLPLKWALEREGFEVLNWGYRSRSTSVRDAGEALSERVAALEQQRDGVRVHFVGHSLGGIVIRYVLAHHRPANVGRVVMLAPPNQGSAKADQLESFSWILKPLAELTTDERSTARSIPPADDVEFGVIAGERDSKVTVEETHLEGETDHVVVPSGHTFIMARPKVHELVVQFLRTGRFDAASDAKQGAARADQSSRPRNDPMTKSQ